MLRRGVRAKAMAVVAVAVLAAAGMAGFVACVIADPPAALPTVPPSPPEILRESVAPPVTSILRAWPSVFTIPIQVDPTVTVDWEYFVDYDPQSGSFAESRAGQIDPGDGPDADVRILEISEIAPPVAGCHTIEVLVAPNFDYNHTPNGQGDSVTWFYTSDDLSNGCQVYAGDAGADAGLDGAGG
jgi:hypothetical protein